MILGFTIIVGNVSKMGNIAMRCNGCGYLLW